MSNPEYHPKDRRGQSQAPHSTIEPELEELPEAPSAPAHPSTTGPSQPTIPTEIIEDFQEISGSSSVPNSPPLSPTLRTFTGCSSISSYTLGTQIGSGTFGNVIIGFEKSTGKKFALKNIKINSEREGMPMTALREIRILRRLKHPNVIGLKEIAVKPGNRGLQQTYMVFRDY